MLVKREVQIKRDGSIVKTYTISLGGVNYSPTEADFVKEGMRCAREGGIIPPADGVTRTVNVT